MKRILIIVATEIEQKSFVEIATNEFNLDYEVKPHGNKSYFQFDSDQLSLFLVRTRMGTSGRGASLSTTIKAINHIEPDQIIMCGISFGCDIKKCNIGDVLVSEQLASYDLKRLGTNETDGVEIIDRGDKTTASTTLIDRFQTSSALMDKNYKVKFGLILSGETLLDNLEYKEKLIARFPESIGGEMEGAGLYSAAENIDWIVVKAVCDWANGKKSFNKSKNQKLASTNSAHFVLSTILSNNYLSSAVFPRHENTSIKLQKSNDYSTGFLDSGFLNELLSNCNTNFDLIVGRPKLLTYDVIDKLNIFCKNGGKARIVSLDDLSSDTTLNDAKDTVFRPRPKNSTEYKDNLRTLNYALVDSFNSWIDPVAKENLDYRLSNRVPRVSFIRCDNYIYFGFLMLFQNEESDILSERPYLIIETSSSLGILLLNHFEIVFSSSQRKLWFSGQRCI